MFQTSASGIEPTVPNIQTSELPRVRCHTAGPGAAWTSTISGAPQFSAGFCSADCARAEDAAKSGLNVGFAFPYTNGGNETWVVSFLSAPNTPIARRFEIWHPAADGDTLHFHSGYCSSGADLDALYSGKVIRKGEGSIGAALAADMVTVDVTAIVQHPALDAARDGVKKALENAG